MAWYNRIGAEATVTLTRVLAPFDTDKIAYGASFEQRIERKRRQTQNEPEKQSNNNASKNAENASSRPVRIARTRLSRRLTPMDGQTSDRSITMATACC
jgi:hypothetical protein